MFTKDELWELFEYNPEKSDLVWRVQPAKAVAKGSVAGYLNSDGFLMVGIRGKVYYAHRLIYTMMSGKWPESDEMVTHVNDDRIDNRWQNLKKVKKSTILQNKRKYKNNESGYTGVYRVTDKRYRAYINVNRQRISLGYYPTAEQAANRVSDYRASVQ